MVTISGYVRNVETLMPASGIRVSLFGTNYHDSRPTGSDGRYSIQVPKGSPLFLYTDDFDTTTTDQWFRFINVETTVTPIASQDDDDWSIHCCPSTHVPEKGSVAAFDNFLQNADDTTGNRFVPTSSAASGGIVVLAFFQCDGGLQPEFRYQGAFTPGMRVTSSTPSFPVAYVNGPHFIDFFGKGPPDWSLGPNIFHPSSWQATDSLGFVIGFGDPAAGLTSLTLEIADSVATRGLAFETPWTIPIRPGTISMGFVGSVDRQANQGFRTVAKCLGLIP
jgi:hypothetical protein